MFADKKQHDNRMRKFRNRKIIMLQLWLGFHLQWLTKSKHSCQNVERRTGETQHWTKSGKFARKQRATLLHWIVPGKRGELTCVMAAMYTAMSEEDSQSSTAEVLPLRFNSFGRRDRFYQWGSLPICDYRNCMWKWINLSFYA